MTTWVYCLMSTRQSQTELLPSRLSQRFSYSQTHHLMSFRLAPGKV
jgi:hypothetical protein